MAARVAPCEQVPGHYPILPVVKFSFYGTRQPPITSTTQAQDGSREIKLPFQRYGPEISHIIFTYTH